MQQKRRSYGFDNCLSNAMEFFKIVFDTGASMTVSFCRDDFISTVTPAKPGLNLKGISKGLPVEGVGTLRWRVRTDDGSFQDLTTQGYYVPKMKIWLFSPHTHFMTSRDVTGSFIARHESAIFEWDGGKRMTIPYHHRTRLPIVEGFHAESVHTTDGTSNVCVTDDLNDNLSGNQKLLLKWHFRLGHIGFEFVQWLARRGFLPICIA
ncbi:MAG: GAG-pre-integrase domain-containing protein, partial [Gaiellaceae bacterium]